VETDGAAGPARAGEGRRGNPLRPARCGGMTLRPC
jgi:hypothetical protein